ncbi:hypothetical protein APY04_3448 [Hyphomicrobium sulfonivorans]|uniref:Uncharacterized protein n=1 Tax=Hyphomicrobium sulfonivorans TaxID=121290 RepID=A0A120CT71_HYPSL|nr:hypothetical protein [Hyphomicrobium sulfonivorans]KWT64184.1 hypothetical protein APY04_3448 [Hyphomicrobium sulfonivorans]
MSVATAKAVTIAADLPSTDYRFVGLLVIALFPALFWTALIAAVGSMAGTGISQLTLLTIGTTIMATCGLIGQLLFARVQNPS